MIHAGYQNAEIMVAAQCSVNTIKAERCDWIAAMDVVASVLTASAL